MCFQHIHRHKHEASNHNPSVPNSSVANLCDVLPTYTSQQASNHNPSVPNSSVANLCDVLPTYTSSQAFDPNQTVSNSSGIHPLSMDQAPPRDPPHSNARTKPSNKTTKNKCSSCNISTTNSYK
eukprot:1057330_1